MDVLVLPHNRIIRSGLGVYFENVAILLTHLLPDLPDVQSLQFWTAEDLISDAVQALKMRFVCRRSPPQFLSHVIACSERQYSELEQRNI